MTFYVPFLVFLPTLEACDDVDDAKGNKNENHSLTVLKCSLFEDRNRKIEIKRGGEGGVVYKNALHSLNVQLCESTLAR